MTCPNDCPYASRGWCPKCEPAIPDALERFITPPKETIAAEDRAHLVRTTLEAVRGFAACPPDPVIDAFAGVAAVVVAFDWTATALEAEVARLTAEVESFRAVRNLQAGWAACGNAGKAP